jgi:hypothetical protein
MQLRGEKTRWLDKSENVTKVYRAVWTVCAVLLLAEPFVHKHGEFAMEEWFGFHAFFGFVAAFGLVLAAKRMRRWLRRPEDYYDRR